MTKAQERALARRQRNLDRRWPYRKVADYVEQVQIQLARGVRHDAIAAHENVAKRGDTLMHLALSAEANGMSPARAKKLAKASRFFRRCASEIAVLLWGDVEDVA